MSEHDEGLVERVAMAIDPVAWLHGEVQGHLLNQARAAIRVLAPELRHDPPEGCEAVWLPTGVVDWFAATRTLVDGTPGGVVGVVGVVGDACRDVVARRPKPEPRTEWGPWWEAAGRRLAEPLNGETLIVRVERESRAEPTLVLDGGETLDADSTVEVLAEDGAE